MALVCVFRDRQHLNRWERGGRRHFFWWVKYQERKHWMGNNGVCWGSGESSGLVQRFLNMARERIEASVKCYYFRVRKKWVLCRFCSACGWRKLLVILSVSNFMFSCLMSSKENSILGKVFFFGYLLETGKSVNISKIPYPLSYIFKWKKRNDSTLRTDVYLWCQTHHGFPALRRKG